MRATLLAAAICLAGRASAADYHTLYGFKLGQELRLAQDHLGEPAKVIPFEDGWKAYVFVREKHVVIFETDETRPDVIISIQLEGERNPAGLGLDGIDLGSSAAKALEKLGTPTARKQAVDEVTHEDVPGTFVSFFGRGLSVEEKDGKVSSVKILFAGPSAATDTADLEAFLRAVKEKDLYRLAESISSDLTLAGEKAIRGPIIGALQGKTDLHAFLFGKGGVGSLRAKDAEANLRLTEEADGRRVSGAVFKFKGAKVRELFFVRSFEGWVLYDAW
jgi:hypothetical protein